MRVIPKTLISRFTRLRADRTPTGGVTATVAWCPVRGAGYARTARNGHRVDETARNSTGMSFDPTRPRVTSHAALHKQVYGGHDEPVDNPTAFAPLPATVKPEDLRLPPRLFVDKQQLLKVPTARLHPMKESTWKVTEAQFSPRSSRNGRPSTADASSVEEFWKRLDEQEALLQLASQTTAAGRHLIAVRRADALAETARRSERVKAASMRPQTANMRPVDAIPGLANYVPNHMAGSYTSREIAEQKPFNRRLHPDVAGARVLSIPQLYKDGLDYMSMRFQNKRR